MARTDLDIDLALFQAAAVTAIHIAKISKLLGHVVSMVDIRGNQIPREIIIHWIGDGILIKCQVFSENISVLLAIPNEIETYSEEYQERIRECQKIIDEIREMTGAQKVE